MADPRFVAGVGIPLPEEDVRIPPRGEVLVDRFVRITDEVEEAIAQRGLPSLGRIMASALEGVAPDHRQAVIQHQLRLYQRQVQEPVEADVRASKAFSPAGVKKIAVPFIQDPVLFHQALEGIEPDLLLASAPEISHMTLRVLWPRYSALHSFPPGAIISSADRNMLALYVGPYRPGFSTKGFYLTYDVRENSITVIPPLPPRSVSMFSHCTIGTGVAVVARSFSREYFLAELLLKRDRGYPSCNATLFRWCSSGPTANQWVQKEVVLPLPLMTEEHTSMTVYTFTADTVFPVGDMALCWTDLLQGILVCDGVCTVDPKFRYIGLPKECCISSTEDRGRPEAYRAICCCVSDDDYLGVSTVGVHMVKFVLIDGYSNCCPTLRMWVLRNFKDCRSKWVQIYSYCFEGILQPDLVPTYPMLSFSDTRVIYITVAPDLKNTHERIDDCRRFVLCIDIQKGIVLLCHPLPPGSGRTPFLTFVSTIPMYSHKTIGNGTGGCEEETAIKSSYRRCFRSFQPMLGQSVTARASAPNVVGLASLVNDFSEQGGKSPP